VQPIAYGAGPNFTHFFINNSITRFGRQVLNDGQQFTGQMDDVRIYTGQLDDTSILAQ
jgi:hypothetical protein